jgi:hypothetical protein
MNVHRRSERSLVEWIGVIDAPDVSITLSVTFRTPGGLPGLRFLPRPAVLRERKGMLRQFSPR